MLTGVRFSERLIYPLLLCAVVLAVLYPFSTFMYMPKWDSMNGFLPYRYFISFFLQHGADPFWNPFQRLGYPGYADLQSGCWYPVTRIIMLFGQYDVTGLIVELLSCYLIAALGMYRLSLWLHQCRKTAFLLGLAYALSGFMVGSAHLMVFLIGVAWLPWIIWSVLAFLRHYERKYALYAAAFIAMNITGASPAYTIVLVYVLAGMILYHVIRHVHSLSVFGELVKASWPALLLLTLLCAPYVLSFLDFAPYFNRLGKRPYEEMILNPLSFGNYLSFVFPFAVNDVKSEWFKPTDLSLRNVYTGWVVLVAFLSALFSCRDKTKYYIPLIICTFISLWLAFGDLTFLYRWVYHLPGFGLFRHPSFFRSYALFCIMLLAGFRLKEYFQFGEWTISDKVTGALLAVFVFVVTAIAAVRSSAASLKTLLNEVADKAEIVTADVWTMILFNAVLIIAVLLVVVLLVRIFRLSFFSGLVIFTVMEMAMVVRLTGPTTMYYTFSYDKMKDYFCALPNDFVQPDLHKAMKFYDDKNGVRNTDGIWVNVSTFNKSVSWQGENPLRFAAFETAWKNGRLDVNLENPLFYSPEKMVVADSLIGPGLIWNAPSYPVECSNKMSITSAVVDFNCFRAHVNNDCASEQWLILNQNYHHLWSATMNGMHLDVHSVNDMLMGVLIPPAADGEIVFEYKSPLIIPVWYFAICGWLLIPALILKDFFNRKSRLVH